MENNSTIKLLDKNGKPFASRLPHAAVHTAESLELSPLDDPNEWLRHPAHTPPAEVDIEREQRSIDSIVGTTRGNEPIIKLVWAGDRSFWLKFFMSWNSAGRPNREAVARPLIRYGTVRSDDGEFRRDVFPARWLLLSRIEPEQYADSYRENCYAHAPEISGMKQIQPDEVPKVMWLYYRAIGVHTNFCCGTAARAKKKCFGTYAPPSVCHVELGEQKRACEKSGFKTHNPFEQIDGETVRLAQNENTGYYDEIERMKVQQQIYMDNPMALLGVMATMNGDFDGARGKQIVKDYYDRKIDKQLDLINKKEQ